MLKKVKSQQSGFSYVIILLIILVVGAVSIVGWRVYSASQSKPKPQATTVSTRPASSVVKETPKPADSPSTIDSPQKIATSDGKQYFIYGAPAGQNNTSPKKILITLHGTEGSAEKDYEIWKPFIKDKQYALASLNWWDGSGDQTTDYTTPEVVNAEIHSFLSSQGYSKNDLIVFEGFSRGSSNSYAIVSFDQASSEPLIDIAVSSSGGSQSAYYADVTKSISSKTQGKIFANVKWILACGGKDPNPSRDGCLAMESTKQFVSDKGATVLGLLSDPNGGHGALTTSSLGLANQMLDLISSHM